LAHPDDVAVGCDADDVDAAVVVRERDSRLLDATDRHTLLQLEVLALARERLAELLHAEEGRKVFSPGRVKQRICQTCSHLRVTEQVCHNGVRVTTPLT
jgi:hypothetical protein